MAWVESEMDSKSRGKLGSDGSKRKDMHGRRCEGEHCEYSDGGRCKSIVRERIQTVVQVEVEEEWS